MVFLISIIVVRVTREYSAIGFTIENTGPVSISLFTSQKRSSSSVLLIGHGNRLRRFKSGLSFRPCPGPILLSEENRILQHGVIWDDLT